MAEPELDLSGKTDPDEPTDDETPKRRTRKPRAPRQSSSKAQDAAAAFKDGVVKLGEALSERDPEGIGAILKRDAGKMGEVVGHHAARNPTLYRAVIFMFGPGSVVYAVRAFGPTLLHLRAALRERRERRQVEAEIEAGLRAPDGEPVS